MQLLVLSRRVPFWSGHQGNPLEFGHRLPKLFVALGLFLGARQKICVVDPRWHVYLYRSSQRQRCGHQHSRSSRRHRAARISDFGGANVERLFGEPRLAKLAFERSFLFQIDFKCPSYGPPPPGAWVGGVILYPLLGVRHAEQCRRIYCKWPRQCWKLVGSPRYISPINTPKDEVDSSDDEENDRQPTATFWLGCVSKS